MLEKGRGNDEAVVQFWVPRPSFREPIPELEKAADLLNSAADAILGVDLDLARGCLRSANLPILYDYANSIMGRGNPAIHRFRQVELLVTAVKAKERMPGASVEAAVFARDGWRCRFCGVRIVLPAARKAMKAALLEEICWSGPNISVHAPFFALSATLDHVVPYSRGGDNNLENLVTACWPCNFGRMHRLVEEVGLVDPRTRPPVIDGWDGLRRILSLTKGKLRVDTSSAGKPDHQQDRVLTETQWFSQLGMIEAGVSDRLRTLIASCDHLGVSWSIRKFLMVRMDVGGVGLQIFGIEPNGDVHIPWHIGNQKRHFRSFAERLAATVPGAVAYETPKTWTVARSDRTFLSITEFMSAAATIYEAIERLHKAVLNNPVPK